MSGAAFGSSAAAAAAAGSGRSAMSFGTASGAPSAAWPPPGQPSGQPETLLPSATLTGVAAHMRAASASLRKYSVSRPASAISGLATTFARRPKPPYVGDIGAPTPCERIASNFTPRARGLSPRTLERLSPGGIQPGALGPLPAVQWGEAVDAVDAVDGVPEADGVVKAAKKRMSFMPLELFDNLEYEAHSPQEWVALGAADSGVGASPALPSGGPREGGGAAAAAAAVEGGGEPAGTPADTLLYQIAGDQYVWSPCWVVGWDGEQRLFEVVLPGGKRKAVKRLNLRFRAEPQQLFERRVAEAKVERESAEQELR